MTRKIRTTNAKVRSVAKPYEPTPGERLLMESYFARQAGSGTRQMCHRGPCPGGLQSQRRQCQAG